jgi:hypothetical protein
VTLSAEGSSDPNGDTLAFRWWHYDDVDTSKAKIDIAGSGTQSGASFVVPVVVQGVSSGRLSAPSRVF